MVNNRNAFGTSLLRTDHLRSTWDPANQAFIRGQPELGIEMADELESRIIALHGAGNIAAVIIEPIASIHSSRFEHPINNNNKPIKNTLFFISIILQSYTHYKLHRFG
jgi:adenosylmethionine-8-amino-7-oxononanoate aminotransferase